MFKYIGENPILSSSVQSIRREIGAPSLYLRKKFLSSGQKRVTLLTVLAKFNEIPANSLILLAFFQKYWRNGPKYWRKSHFTGELRYRTRR